MHNRQMGFSLIEGLLAILVFSVGILGLVGLQATSIKAVADAKYRIDASYLADRIISQMWIDDHTTATLQSNYQTGTGTTPYTTWKNLVQASLPQKAGTTPAPTISVDANNVVTVTVYWTPPSVGDSQTHNFVAVAQIR